MFPRFLFLEAHAPYPYTRNTINFPSLLLLFLLIWLCFSTTLPAAISVGPYGSGVITFDTPPPVGDWSTHLNPGASGDINTSAALDAAIQTNSASAFGMPLTDTSVVSPSIAPAGTAQWNSTLQLLQTVPTGVAYVSLLATLRNDTGMSQSGLLISYDFNEWNPPGTMAREEIPGHRVYYSLTGLAGSWQVIPELSSADVPGRLSATLELGTWVSGGEMYLLWADDNATVVRVGGVGPAIEGGYSIDNVAFAPVPEPSLVSLAGLGVLLLLFWRQRSRKARSPERAA